MMLDLSEEGLRLVRALVKAPVAWQSAAQLASATGLGLEETTDLLATLDEGGWVSPWERERDVVVTLSAGAAWKLGVRLVESGREEVARWAGVGDPEPPAPKASGVFRGGLSARMELVIDPSPAPDEAAEKAEEAAGRPAPPGGVRPGVCAEKLPGPTLLIGLGLTPWPGPGDGRKASCPACGSKRLKPSMYCLYCDRWGLDHRLLDEPAARPRAVRDAASDALRRDLERKARKEKRRARRFAQASEPPRRGRGGRRAAS